MGNRTGKKGEGPTLLECRTYRWKGHVGPDCDYKQGCRPKEELESWMDKCPIDTFKNQLVAKNIFSEETYHSMVREIDSQLEFAIRSARQGAFPGPDEVFKDVYYPGV